MQLEAPNLLTEMKTYKVPYSLLVYGSTLITVVAGVMVAYHLLMKMKAEDEHTSAQHTRALRTTVMGALLLMAIGHVFWLMVHFTGMANYLDKPDANEFAPCYGFIWNDLPECPVPGK